MSIYLSVCVFRPGSHPWAGGRGPQAGQRSARPLQAGDAGQV